MPDGKAIDLREHDDADANLAGADAAGEHSLTVAFADRFKWIERALKARLL